MSNYFFLYRVISLVLHRHFKIRMELGDGNAVKKEAFVDVANMTVSEFGEMTWYTCSHS
jgi:hypothetical protein